VIENDTTPPIKDAVQRYMSIIMSVISNGNETSHVSMSQKNTPANLIYLILSQCGDKIR